jgi:CD2 antigen cytoplasmic tail-binding protein 2
MKVDNAPAHSRTEIEQMTHLATGILALGDADIYSKTYESLVRSVRGSGAVDATWDPPSADLKFEYKWASPEDGQADETFGPFGEEEMRSWHKAEYFGPAGERVVVRPVGGIWASWDDVLPRS